MVATLLTKVSIAGIVLLGVIIINGRRLIQYKTYLAVYFIIYQLNMAKKPVWSTGFLDQFSNEFSLTDFLYFRSTIGAELGLYG